MNYAYKTPSGGILWISRTLKEGPPTTILTEDGKVAKRCYQAERAGRAASKGWPLECEASGVHPDQAGELRSEYKRLGLKVEVSNEGNPIYTSPEHRRRALKARGFHDRNSYT